MFLAIKLFFYRATAVILSFLGLMPWQLSDLPNIDASKASISVVEKSGYASRVMPLGNGTLIGGYEQGKVIKTKISRDDGKTWESTTTAASVEGLDCDNVNFYEKDGIVYLAYRAIGYRGDGSFYGSIQVSLSDDFGLTWKWHSLVIENLEKDGTFKGVWEPCLGEIDGKLVCVYANDSTSVTTYQNIESMTFDGEKWTDRRILSNGEKHDSRDGMPVWCKLPDGGYAMVIESTKYRGNDQPFVIQILYSENGIDWSDPYDVYVPTVKDRDAAAPGICALDDGRIAVTFQTDEDKEERSPNICITKIVFSDGTERPKSPLKFTTPQKVFPDEFDARSNWGGVYENDGKIYYSAGSKSGAILSVISYGN